MSAPQLEYLQCSEVCRLRAGAHCTPDPQIQHQLQTNPCTRTPNLKLSQTPPFKPPPTSICQLPLTLRLASLARHPAPRRVNFEFWVRGFGLFFGLKASELGEGLQRA